MAGNLRDVRSAVMTGQAKVEAWREEFTRRWTQPYQEATLQIFWNSIPDEVHAELERLAPEAHRKFSAYMDQMRERQQWPK